MKIFLDTSLLVDLQRKNKSSLNLIKRLRKKHDLMISVITVSEIITGAYLSERKKSLEEAKEFLMRFEWVNINAEIAEKAGKIVAERIISGTPVEFQDNLITATFIAKKGDYFITENKKHYCQALPENKVLDTKKALKVL